MRPFVHVFVISTAFAVLCGVVACSTESTPNDELNPQPLPPNGGDDKQTTPAQIDQPPPGGGSTSSGGANGSTSSSSGTGSGTPDASDSGDAGGDG
jgi:hypothetical protein